MINRMRHLVEKIEKAHSNLHKVREIILFQVWLN